MIRGGLVVLNDLCLQIPLGCHTAILGPNGSGKSTLIKLITRELYPLYRGEPSVRILGRDRWDVFELRSMLGIVTGDLQSAFAALEGRRGIDAVLTGYFASNGVYSHQRITDEMLASARDALARVGAIHLANREIGTMSTGEARRVIIARALVHEPKALLLDEPTNGLDLPARHQLLKMVSGLAQGGDTLLLVTHHLEEIVAEIEQVVLLKGGQVLANGPKAEILTSSMLSAAFDASVHVRHRSGRYLAEME